MKITPIYAHSVALAGFFGLFILSMLWHTVLAPPTKIPVALVLLLTVTPLLLPMRGLLNGKPKSCAWAAYISLLYFVHGSIETYSNPGERLYAALEVMFSLMLFFGAIAYVRWVKK
jgi:uncharacterized membrane protein